MKRLILLSFVILFTNLCHGQTDTIFTNSEKILCNIGEITPDAIKFTYPGESLINTIYKNTVRKIVFKSGRTQTFSESTAFKKVEGAGDFDNVSLTQVESEIKGLYKLGDLSSKAKGATVYANQEKVKERAIRKLKIFAAMMGANVVYLINQRTEGNKMGTKSQAGSTAETNLTGIAYASQIPNYDEFTKKINGKKDFQVIQKVELGSNSSDLSMSEIKGDFTINSIKNEGGLIIINGVLKGEKNQNTFRVVYFDNESFTIYFEDKSTSYNFKIII